MNYKNLTYHELLQDERWKNKRDEIISRDGRCCLNCGSNENLEVHHRQYHISMVTSEFILPWTYSDRYLITLCSKCHHSGHAKYKIPVFKVNN